MGSTYRTRQLSTNCRYLMDPHITQSEVRLNRALEQRGQMDQQMLEKFQFEGSKCRSRILVFTYASVEPINFFFFDNCWKQQINSPRFSDVYLQQKLTANKADIACFFTFVHNRKVNLQINYVFQSVSIRKLSFKIGRHPALSIQN